MHYTLLHLGSGQEVHEVKVRFHNRDRDGREEYYLLKTFANIREARNYINRFRFYEDVNGMVVSDIIRRTRQGMSTVYCSKHTLEIRKYV